ncbi:MAG TPA: fibrobacter succinogenes major paralogous domain-containing protein [Bacteroidales bacterium]|nr:fibrobacter succinogenes major paralogous domain-containing protein [Bacteroidales bacterium]HOK74357.1 fibrobacter succinogenes major paralogous domain-containing protein [Bacteroidales bacterium]HOM41043.1 fibrobacter succinogenes major paralogous domain-containing protein [Bacteroidales bacterium]HPP92107.1 fibrobacter succinogenes major paralogous domain-containing protein [Bacteroidales bacterium]HQK70024.1 fibrobacter succinogenes major paralogous domain-containing protein [Bacteroidal
MHQIRVLYRTSNKIICIIISFILTTCYEETSPKIFPDYTGQTDTIIDIEGNVYRTIEIESKIWMAENLRTTKLNNGRVIIQVKDNYDLQYNKAPAYCWYNNDSVSFSNIYGALYNFYAVSTDSLCLTGWHVPTDSDWDELINFLGGHKKAGGKLKDYYRQLWSEPNLCFANNYGFSALPGGMRQHYEGKFINVTLRGYWWTSTSINYFEAYAIEMYNENAEILKFYGYKGEGYSVRCIKD